MLESRTADLMTDNPALDPLLLKPLRDRLGTDKFSQSFYSLSETHKYRSKLMKPSDNCVVWDHVFGLSVCLFCARYLKKFHLDFDEIRHSDRYYLSLKLINRRVSTCGKVLR